MVRDNHNKTIEYEGASSCNILEIQGNNHDNGFVQWSHTCWCCASLFQAPHTSIFKVIAVVVAHWVSGTISEPPLCACTLDIVQPDISTALAKECKADSSSPYRGILQHD